MKKLFSATMLLLAISNIQAQGYPATNCAYGARPPAFPTSTMIHIVLWDLTTELAFRDADITTLVLAPPNIQVGNNPFHEVVNMQSLALNERVHGVAGPLPLPSGIWEIIGTVRFGYSQCNPYACYDVFHPNNPFPCTHLHNQP